MFMEDTVIWIQLYFSNMQEHCSWVVLHGHVFQFIWIKQRGEMYGTQQYKEQVKRIHGTDISVHISMESPMAWEAFAFTGSKILLHASVE